MFIPSLHLRGSETEMRSASHAARDQDNAWPPAILTKPVLAYRTRGRSVALVTDPDAVKTILCSGEDKFPKWLPIYRTSATRHGGPNSILAVEGKLWQDLHSNFSPIFAPNQVDHLIRNSEAATRFAMGDLTGVHDLFALGNHIAIDVMWRTVLGQDETAPSDSGLRAVSERMIAAFDRDDLDGAAICILDLVAAISTRQPGPLMPPDHPFRHLTAAGGTNPTGLSDAEIADNLFALIYAGQETTSLSVAWTLWLLGQDPALQEEVRREIASVPADELFSRGGINRLTLLNCVLKETMRLLSPALVTVRTNTEPMTIAGTELPAGTVIVVPFYALHRKKDLWDEPDAFRPQRFAPGSPEPRHAMAFIPFSSGRHTCLAAKSSLFEIQAVLAAVLRAKRVVTLSPETMTLHTSMSARPGAPMLVEISNV